jgi:hypothetical protein
MKLLTLVSAVLISLGFVQSATSADTPSPIYVVVDYMKVAKDKTADYLEVEKIWKKIHQKRVERGLINSWFLYKVENAAQNARDYQFVTVQVFDSFAKLENPYPDDIFTAVYPGPELAGYMKKTGESRDLIRSEIYHLESAALDEAKRSEHPTITVSFMQPAQGKDADYYKMERDIFQKLHKERIKRDILGAWFFLSRTFPGGSEVPYSYLTLNVFPSAEKAKENTYPDDLLKTVFPDKDVSKVAGDVEAMRKMVKNDTWQSLDKVTKDSSK